MTERVTSWLAGRRPSQLVLGLTLLLLLAAVVAWRALAPGTGVVRDFHIWWPLLAVMFTVAEVVVLHVHVNRQAQTVALSEIPMVLGLLCVSPRELVLARVLGSVVAFTAFRRQPWLKSVFNTVLVLVGSTTALAVFLPVLGGGDSFGPRGWAAAYAAMAALNVVDALAVTLVIALVEQTVRLGETLRETATSVAMSAAVTTLALTAVNDVSTHHRDAVLLLLQAAILFSAYRTYASLSRRHLGLERVYRFSQVLSRSPEVDTILVQALEEARGILRAEVAEVTLFQDTGRTGARVALSRGGRLVRSDAHHDAGFGWLQAQTFQQGAAAVLPRGTRDAELRAFLQGRAWSDAVVVPLRGDAGVIGALLVADRLGDIDTFEREDILLLETVANHASMALQNGQLVDRLRHDSLHDALTGLPNRVRLQQELEAALEQVASGAQPGATVMVLDLDGFKDVNDTLGHAQGDRLLQEVGHRLTSAVGSNGSVARLGGDEFAVLLPRTSDEEAALRIGRQVLQALEQPIALDELQVEVGASVGIALAPGHASAGPALLKRADMAMYAAKASTRGLRVYEPEQDTPDAKRITLVGELRQALADGALRVHVQPQARCSDGRVVSVEALVRWPHPELGMVSPDEFIPVAERSGLIAPLTAFVLDTSLAAVARWRAAGHDLSIAVNLSTRSLLDVDLVEDVRRVLRRHGLPGEALTLEITESGVMADPARAVALLHELRALGVRLSVDDFGTGYSSLSYLKRLPVQEVKIDKSFVLSLRADADDQAIARSIIDLGRHLGFEIVAEGVEDAGTWDLLSGMGCTIAQGWHLSRPMPLDDLPGWLAAHAGRPPGPALRAVGAAVRGLAPGAVPSVR